jgi:hypothetical protein
MPDPPTPRWIRDAVAKLPRRPDREGPTRGFAFDATGRDVGGGVIRSHEDLSLADDLDPRARSWLSVISHVESHVAAKMRRGKASDEVTVVVNNDVCFGPRGCDPLLSGMLRPGQRMRVYVTDAAGPDGVRFYKDFEGNGRGIRP